MTETLILESVINERKNKNLYCGRGCSALKNGTCIGRAESDETRPLISYEDANEAVEVFFADLTVKALPAIPEDCPFNFNTIVLE
jgi:hypothetical protein